MPGAVIASPAALAGEGDRLFASHAHLMAATHDRSGANALLHYNVANALRRQGTATFVRIEVYAGKAGLDDHLSRSGEWDELDAFHTWLDACEVRAVLDGEV